ncbi:MAG: hypothetical protein HOM68_18485 [Gemmatimonadetes bacterium]|jgi:hypothetical protein|nr:hypothetical protein [Gemmatimonadota bacterium]MBT4612224.1 hypothetical protein [Gemmatimonadota bacterium]MBT5058535.1 hypothetical protein [Gemmatimonadota bacterium]MBT5144855.1 hypothetical protein [Gemmatimonadota bacterium]MBT5586504.1 hypothetical protein [Gemmatimonadota bacterium]
MAERKKLAIITTFWDWRSHANHMGERFLVGYPRDGRWHHPDFDIVGAYVDQCDGDDDLSGHRAEKFGFTVYPTIAEALRLGTDQLAVDAVLLIAEHGDYPSNDKGQKLYPRFEFFSEIVDVFRASGRSVPVFNDKHLSYSFDKAQQMVAMARELDFPLLSGSSLPVTFRLPPITLDGHVDEALMIGVGGSDAMDYHALEALQSMVERRQGGETGVRAVQLIEGADVWRAGEDGRWSRRLLEGALARSDSRSGIALTDGRPQDLAHSDELEELVEAPSAYLIEYVDGLRATLLMLNGAVSDFTFAARCNGEVRSLQFLLPGAPNVVYSACLMQKAEEMFVSGKAPYPAERTMFVCGMLERCLESKISDHQRVETPELILSYQPPATPQFVGAPTESSTQTA